MKITPTQMHWLEVLATRGARHRLVGPNASGTEIRLCELGLAVRVLDIKAIFDDQNLRVALDMPPRKHDRTYDSMLVATAAGMNATIWR